MLSGPGEEGVGVSLDRALEALVASEPFERLLLERARPILAQSAREATRL